MQNRILHERLQNNIQTRQRTQFFRNLDLKMNRIVIVEFLDIDIDLYMLHLFTDADQILAVVQTQPVKTGQIPRDLFDILRLIVHGDPVDQIQCIVQKMRIDLCLQNTKLRHPRVLTELKMLPQQPAYLSHHKVEVPVYLFHLIALLDRRQLYIEITFLQMLHFHTQFFQPAHIIVGQKVRCPHDHDHHDHHRHRGAQHQTAELPVILTFRDQSHQLPACIFYRLPVCIVNRPAHSDRFPCLFPFREQKGSLLLYFLKQIRIGRYRSFPLGIDQINQSVGRYVGILHHLHQTFPVDADAAYAQHIFTAAVPDLVIQRQHAVGIHGTDVFPLLALRQIISAHSEVFRHLLIVIPHHQPGIRKNIVFIIRINDILRDIHSEPIQRIREFQ